jgi:hypothetical protein
VQVGNFGADVTLDLAKSQSAFLACAPEEIAAQVEGIYTSAGRESISALERWTAYGMHGRHGDGDETETVKTSGSPAGCWCTARPGPGTMPHTATLISTCTSL